VRNFSIPPTASREMFFFHFLLLLKALHNSHSTLDRTCSDSAVSLKHRKSTSDLTTDEAFHKENDNCSSSTAAHKHRRRGSSKGGLAYLVEKRDSRRGSRESIMSHQTNVSNEDLAPLTTFQQTQRGRQRRTSNFLELPGENR
jgi:Rad and Gem related GTP binding protein 1